MTIEHLNTEDGVVATKRTAPKTDPAPATANLSADDICDYCHVRMTPARQLNLNDVTHNVMVCTADPTHTKNVPA